MSNILNMITHRSMIFLSICVSINVTIYFQIVVPMMATMNNNGMRRRCSLSKNHCQKYNGILVKSTSNAMLAIVAIYCSLGSLNGVMNAHLSTHPVQMRPALHHERNHQILPYRIGFLIRN